jgi:hypothetical protein
MIRQEIILTWVTIEVSLARALAPNREAGGVIRAFERCWT